MKYKTFLLSFYLLHSSCSSNSSSNALKEENDKLKLQKENIELKKQINELENESNTTNDNKLQQQYYIWKSREYSKAKISLEKTQELYDDALKKKNDKVELTPLEEVNLIFGEQNIEEFRTLMVEIDSDKFYKQWYEWRSRGEDRKLIDNPVWFKD